MPIEAVKIPDSDIPGWIKTLREGGFSDKEINELLSRKNPSYAKGAGVDPVEEELKRIEHDLAKRHKRKLNNEQREYLKKAISERPEFKDFKSQK